MANNKLNKSLRNSIAAETKSVDMQHSLDTIPEDKQAISTSEANSPKPNDTGTAKKPAAAKAAVSKIAAKKKPTEKRPILEKKPVSSSLDTTKNKQVARPKVNASNKAAKLTTPTKAQLSTNTAAKLQDNPVVELANNKLHRLVKTNYQLCETCLENLQKVNDNLHDYLNQLVEVKNVNSLIKLNLSYLSGAPTRYQEMIAQNKNMFSNFFKFARPTK